MPTILANPFSSAAATLTMVIAGFDEALGENFPDPSKLPQFFQLSIHDILPRQESGFHEKNSRVQVRYKAHRN
nr:hypothetical protein [uncultured Desulfuromonas sp.]